MTWYSISDLHILATSAQKKKPPAQINWAGGICGSTKSSVKSLWLDVP
jgi:hypothetical protein